MNERYTHRNGEADPPTIEGWYWVDSPSPSPFQQGMILVMDGYAYDFQEEQFPFDRLVAGLRWWGPVTPPWERKPTP